jgi:YgiT-type zinc finger domain-containing protein
MECVICKHGATRPGAAAVTVTRATTIVVIKDVPSDVCDNCGEEYVDETVTARLLRTLEEAAHSRIEVEVRKYMGA